MREDPMFRFRLYCNLLILFWKLFFEIWSYRSFLDRDSRRGTRNISHLGKMISGRVMSEKRRKASMSREDMLFYMVIESLKEKDETNFKEELELPIALLALWYCEPVKKIEESETEEEKQPDAE
jgi:hypothetical protein